VRVSRESVTLVSQRGDQFVVDPARRRGGHGGPVAVHRLFRVRTREYSTKLVIDRARKSARRRSNFRRPSHRLEESQLVESPRLKAEAPVDVPRLASNLLTDPVD